MPASSDFLRNYELAESTIRKLYDSRLRLAILDALKDNPMRLADLRRAVNANAPNTSSKAKELEGMGLLERVEGDFQLTKFGKAVRNRTKDTLEFYATYEKFKDVFENYETSGIPEFLYERLDELNNSEGIITSSCDVTGSEKEFKDMVSSAEEFINTITPVWVETYFDAVTEFLKCRIRVKIITTNEITKKIVKRLDPKITKLWLSENLQIFEVKDLNFSAAVSERFFTLVVKMKEASNLSLFMGGEIRSHDPRAIKWGLDLFEYYKKQAKPVKLSDYL